MQCTHTNMLLGVEGVCGWLRQPCGLLREAASVPPAQPEGGVRPPLLRTEAAGEERSTEECSFFTSKCTELCTLLLYYSYQWLVV